MQRLAVLLIVSLSLFTQQHAKQQNTFKAAATAHDVVLTWGAASVPTGAPPVSGYNIFCATTSGQEGSTPCIQPGNVLTTTYTSVVAGSTYYFEIAAVNSAGQGPISPEISATIPNNVPPGAVPNFTATPQ
jgi:hypothetical protein